MERISFTIGRTRSNVFSREALAKVEAGKDIFCQIIKNNSFRKEIKAFKWEDNEGNIYERFHLCKGLSNSQVASCIQNIPKALGINKEKIQIAILPCTNRKDILAYTSLSIPTLWLHTGFLEQEWFTPVHVASCLMHEICVAMGFGCGITGELVPFAPYTVPYALGYITMKIARQWEHKISDIRDSFDQIDLEKYEYMPCSTIFQLDGVYISKSTCNQQLAGLLTTMNKQIEALKNQEEVLNTEEFARLCTLEISVVHLQKIYQSLIETSLDGEDNISLLPAEAKK